jgi:hypothetical protein
MASEQWGREVHAFYNAQPYWETQQTRGDRYTTRSGQRDSFQTARAGHADNRTFARVLEQHDFELTDAIDKAESHTNGQAISARCQLARSDMRGTEGRNYGMDDQGHRTGDQSRTEDQNRYNRSSAQTKAGEVIIEVATFTPGNTQNLRIVTVCPKTGEVLQTRSATLTGSRTERSSADVEREKLAGGN